MQSPHFPADAAQPSCTSFPPSLSTTLRPAYFAVQFYRDESPSCSMFCQMPSSITPFHGLPSTHPTTDGTFILSLTQPKNPSKQNAENLQPPPGSSPFLPSPLQHQEQCYKAVHKTIQQFH